MSNRCSQNPSQSPGAVGLADLVRRKEVNAQELLEEAIARTAKVDPDINAVVVKHYDYARKQVDDGLPDGRFTGVPFLLKDLDLLRGTVTTFGASIYRNHVADHNGTLAQRFLIGDGAQRTANQSLNFLGAAGLFSPCRFPRRAFFRGARQHSIFAGDPAFARAFQKSRNSITHAGGTNHARFSEFDQHAAFRRGDKVRCDLQGPHLVRAASVRSHWASWELLAIS